MPAYTVHQPPTREHEAQNDPARFVFVRDGFSFPAFLFTPLWMLFRRMWLVLLLYIVAIAALQGALAYAGASSGVRVFAGALIAFLVGLESSTLRRWSLTRRRCELLGFVVGDDRESAEQRFFSSWLEQGRARTTPVTPPSDSSVAKPYPRMPKGDGDILGLFPQPGTPQLGKPAGQPQ
jgi:hypothetical protein